jgi:hypothetical protein
MKALIVLIVVMVMGGVLKAQTFKEGESIREQIKKGTVPGLQFAPVTATEINKEPEQRKNESLVTQIRKGTAPGMKFKTGGGTTKRSSNSTTATPKKGPLPSELKPSPEHPPAPIKPVVPTQEAKTEQ